MQSRAEWDDPVYFDEIDRVIDASVKLRISYSVEDVRCG